MNNNGTLFSSSSPIVENQAMRGLGQRLRERAKELGYADATVAERLGLSQQRYHNYISDQTEPDFQTLVRICEALATEPNLVLGFSAGESGSLSDNAKLRARINATASTMELHTLKLTAAVVDTLAKEAAVASKRTSPKTKADRSAKPVVQDA